MSEKSIDGFEIHYPAPPPLVLDGKPLDNKINEASEKLAYGCNIYEVSPDGDDYILHSQFKLFHFRYKGGLASCSCNDFTYATGKPVAMCEHIAAFLKVSNNFSTRIKPLDAKPGLRGLIEKFCSANSIECKLTPSTAQARAETEKQKEIPKPPPVAKDREQARIDVPKPPENIVKKPEKVAEAPVNTAKAATSLSFLCKGGQHAGCGGFECGCECHKKGTEKPLEKAVEKPPKILPAKQEPAKPPAKKKSDAELDAEIEMAKAERFLQNRGSTYKVQGKERPDSHMIQKVANKHGVSIEILEATQTEDCVHIVVRGHLNDQYVDAVVHHDFKTEYLLKTMEIITKNPAILDHWEGTDPVIKKDAKIKIKEDGRDVEKDAKYYIVHALLSFKKFALRDGRTKAAAIAEALLLNQDFRDPEEKESEEDEVKLVADNMQNRKAVKAEA
ncbi:MAG: hypothetical protein WCE94_02680 [Candidatus Methanoperedens sp.]